MRVLVGLAGQSVGALAEPAPNSNSHPQLEAAEEVAREPPQSMAARAAITARVVAALTMEAAWALLEYVSSPTRRRLLDGLVQI
jgi:hypothetical protein